MPAAPVMHWNATRALAAVQCTANETENSGKSCPHPAGWLQEPNEVSHQQSCIDEQLLDFPEDAEQLAETEQAQARKAGGESHEAGPDPEAAWLALCSTCCSAIQPAGCSTTAGRFLFIVLDEQLRRGP